MKARILIFSLLAASNLSFGQKTFQVDTIKTSEGDLKITFIGHGTLYFTFNNKVVHIDPVNR